MCKKILGVLSAFNFFFLLELFEVTHLGNFFNICVHKVLDILEHGCRHEVLRFLVLQIVVLFPWSKLISILELRKEGLQALAMSERN